MTLNRTFKLLGAALAIASLGCLSPLAAAENAPAQKKNIVVEPVAFQALQQWSNQVEPQMTAPAQIVVSTPVTVPRLSWEPSVPTVYTPDTVATLGNIPFYVPAPLILGAPELPLVNSETSNQLGPQANYQGMQARLVVLKGDVHELHSLKTRLQPGDRFRIRIAPTFNALVTLDQVLNMGGDWKLVRTGQVYPNPGNSIYVKAGQVLDLPLEKGKYFQMETRIEERIVLNVRHEQAKAQTRSDQPVYRQDAKSSSNYVQLVPRGTFPSIEQLISYQSRTR